jgi:type IV pilus assembly protein PilM
MSLLVKLRRLLEEPPPEFVFEFSEAGIAWAHRAKTQSSGFQPFTDQVLSVSPVRDNVLMPEKLQEVLGKLVPTAPNKRRRAAAIILPDYCSRVAVLDFDTFPSDPQEQMSLVRFRVKKSVPFDLEAASVSYHVQPHALGGKKRDVVVAVVSQEILARYEAPLRMAGLHAGLVTLSALVALNMVNSPDLEVVAKLSGKALSVSVVENNVLRMFRCVEMDDVTPADITTVLFPTFAYIEDEFKKKPQRLLLCGFGSLGESLAPELGVELNAVVEPLRSAYGLPSPYNSGLLGYLQQTGVEGVAA